MINNSTMPNAVLQIDAWIRLADGTWHPTLASLREEGTMPINIEPHSSARLPIMLATRLPFDDTRSSNRDRVDQVNEQLFSSRDLKVRIRGVKGLAFESVLAQPVDVVEAKFGQQQRKAA